MITVASLVGVSTRLPTHRAWPTGIGSNRIKQMANITALQSLRTLPTRLRQLTAPPLFPDEADNRVAAILNMTCWLGIAISLAVAAVLLPITDFDFYRLAVLSLLLLVFVSGRWLLVRGRLRLASLVVLLSFWAILVYAVANTGGLHAPSFATLLVVVFCAGLLLGQRGALLMAALSTLAGVALYVAEARGISLMADRPDTLLTQGLGHLANLAAATVLVIYAMRALDAALRRTRQDARALRQHGDLQGLVAEISADFIKRPPELLDEGIDRALARLGEQTESDRTYVFLFRDEAQMLVDNTHEWCAPGVPALKAQMQGLHAPVFVWSLARLREGDNIHMTSPTSLPPEAHALRAFCELLGIRSLVLTPIRFETTLLGFVGFAVVQRDPAWDELTLSGLRLFSDIVANALARRQQEMALRRSEERWRVYFEQANDFLFTLGPTGHIVTVNQIACRTLGYAPEELLGRSPLELVTPDMADLALEVLAGMLGGEDVDQAEIDVFTRNGRRLTLEIRGRSFAEDGQIAGTFHIARDITERKRMEAALRASEERYRTFVATSAEGIWRMEFREPIPVDLPPDEQIALIYAHSYQAEVNDAYLAQYGFTREQAAAASLADKLMPSHAENLEMLRGFIANGYQVANAETRERDRAGNDKFFLATANGVVEDGHLTHIWGLQKDITERKLAEEAVRESEQRFRELYAAAQRQTQELALLDRVRLAMAPKLELTTIFRAVTEAIREEFGYTQVSLYILDGETLRLQHQVGYETTIPEIHISQGVSGEVVRTGQPILLESVADHPGFLGAIEGITSEICVPLFDRGEVVGVLNVESVAGVVLGDRDMQLVIALSEHINLAIERARLYDEVRRSEELFREIFDLAPIGMSITSLDGTYLRVNRALCEMLGYGPDELCGMRFAEITHADDLKANLRLLGAVVDNELSEYKMEKRYVRKDGSLLDVFLQVFALRDTEGRPIQMIGQVVDLSERKQSEEALRQAQKLESLGVMSGGIAHDFNNLLTAILAQSSLAQAKLPAQSPARGHVEKAVKAAERAANLTQQLLAYSGRGRFEIQPVNLNALIRENLHLFEVAIPKHVQLCSELAPTLPAIDADTGQMQQVIMNLILNGAEALGERNGTVLVRTRARHVLPGERLNVIYSEKALPPGRYVLLEVEDNGSGMDRETLSRIFDPFFTTKHTGRGLGLAAVLGIVRGHGGGLSVESAPQRGTTFRLYFPAGAGSPNGTGPLNVDALRATLRGTVLVIDDEEPVRESVGDILRHEGVDVVLAPDGQTGLDLYEKRRDDIRLVILDLSMPGLSGQETLTRLRRLDARVPVMLSSGFSETETGERFENLGVNGFLQKPYRWDQLVAAVRPLLS